MMESDGWNTMVFRYRKAVRCIAIVDTCIALFMLTILGLKFSHHMNSSWGEFSPQIIIIFGIYILQLVMAQVLMTTTYQIDTTIALSRCQKWYYTSLFLYMILGIEFFFIFWYSGPYAIPIIKIMFRAIANHIVNVYMIHLRALLPLVPHPPTDFSENITNQHPFQPINTNFIVSPQNGYQVPIYEPPPSYEESIRDKTLEQDFQHENSEVVPPVVPPTVTTTTTNLTIDTTSTPIPLT